MLTDRWQRQEEEQTRHKMLDGIHGGEWKAERYGASVCWYDCHPFKTIPVPAIMTGRLVHGVYCSGNCAKASLSKDRFSHLATILIDNQNEMIKEFFPSIPRHIQAASNLHELKMFGGTKDIEEWRKTYASDRVLSNDTDLSDYIYLYQK
jgi:hypothetical protein